MNKDKAYLLDMIRSCQLIGQFSQGLNREMLASNLLIQSAILYQLLIIGEAAKRLSIEFRSQHTELPWQDITGMRDIIAHQYDRLDLDIVWQAISTNVPDLLNVLILLLNDLKNI